MLRLWLAWQTWVTATDAWAFGFNPSLVASGAYTWATDQAPVAVYVTGMVLACVTSAWALTTNNHIAAKAALALTAAYHTMFGASILYLTLSGSTAAITGANKWWTFPFMWLAFLSLDTLRNPPGIDAEP